MHAVHRRRASTDDLRELRPRLDEHFVHQVLALANLVRPVIVLDRRLAPLREILVERSSRRDIEHLHAAAHREHRLALRHRPLHERDFHAIAVGSVTPHTGRRDSLY